MKFHANFSGLLFDKTILKDYGEFKLIFNSNLNACLLVDIFWAIENAFCLFGTTKTCAFKL